MRLVTAVSLAVAVLVPLHAGSARVQLSEPFVPVGVWYPRGPANGTAGASVATESQSDSGVSRRELTRIKAAGFNSIRTVVDWAGTEEERGQYRFDRFDGLLSAADEAGLKVIVQVDTTIAPRWLFARYSDSVVVGDSDRVGSASAGYCMDHPGVRSDLGAFIGAAAQKASGHPSFYGIDVWRSPGASSTGSAPFCYCAYTQARFRQALQRKYSSIAALNAAWNGSFPAWRDVEAPRAPGDAPGGLDWKQFFAARLHEDLKFRADASAPRGARPVASHSDGPLWRVTDDWLMTAAVDHYGTAIVAAAGSSQSMGVLASLDLMRSAARTRGWWLGSLHADSAPTGRGAPDTATGADLRMWTWAALARGAGTVTYDDWPRLNAARAAADAGDRLRAAGEVAGVITRNSALFGPLRPHASRVAIVEELPWRANRPRRAAAPAVGDPRLDAYRIFLEQNIPVDFIHPDEVVAGLAARYELVYSSSTAAVSRPVVDALKAFVRAGGMLVYETSAAARTAGSDSDGPTLDGVFTSGQSLPGAPGRVITVADHGAGRAFRIRRAPRTAGARAANREAADAPLRSVLAAAGISPEIKIEGARGVVEARFLESSDAMLLIAINYGSEPRQVTFTFAPDVPEAIWQNMENGAAVNFLQTTEGATYKRTFAGKDAMVLVRGKRLR
jgi:beta-galactosidase